MADSDTLVAFLVTCWVFVVIPGPSVRAVLGGTGGLIMIGLGTRLALTGRRD